jgi:tmRNA-binding protein
VGDIFSQYYVFIKTTNIFLLVVTLASFSALAIAKCIGRRSVMLAVPLKTLSKYGNKKTDQQIKLVRKVFFFASFYFHITV